MIVTAGAGLRERVVISPTGTNDQDVVNVAISNILGAGGGEVYLSAGTYIFNDPSTLGYCLRITKSNITLRLDPAAIIQLKDSVLSGTAICNLIRIGDGESAVDNVSIIGGTLDGNRANNPSTGDIGAGAAMYVYGPVTNVTVRDVLIKNATRQCLYSCGVDGTSPVEKLLVDGCRCIDSAEGIGFAYSEDVVIRNCKISNMIEQDGIESYQGARHWRIENCYIELCNASNSAIDVFAVTGGDDNEDGVITGCTLIANQNYPLQIGNAAGGNIRNITVENNFIDGGGILLGVGTGLSENIAIINNKIKGGGASSTACGINDNIYTQRLIISGNHIWNQGYYAAILRSDNVIVSGNAIFNNGQNTGANIGDRCGIKVLPTAANPIIEGNNIYDDQGTPTQSWPVYADGTTGVICKNNQISGHTQTNWMAANSATGYIFRDNGGVVTEAAGKQLNVADGGTISHGLATTPQSVLVAASTYGEIATVTGWSTTTFTVSIKKRDGSAGTTQGIWWQARIDTMPVH